jgi:hypothetical protein
MGASSPVGAVQSVTRVLERSNEEGPPLMRNLCSGLSAHAVSRCASSLSGSSVARRSQGRNKALHGSLPVVWVTSRHGNAKRPKAAFTGEDEPYAWRVRASLRDCRSQWATFWPREALALHPSHEEE